MLTRLLKKGIKSKIAKFMLLVLTYQLVLPLRSFALTSGPSQPEMQSFEPVGTTNLVDPFTGNFDYNIPLLDIEGYPVNIAYHSGINMEQEASWVGLGWNINPGNITHNVRGVSDDFNGDSIKKTIEINPEVKKRFEGIIGGELFGFIDVSGNFGMNFSNYTGISADFRVGLGASFSSWISGGLNMGLGVSTSDGADFDYGASLGYRSKMSADHSAAINGNFGQSFNSRQGLMNTSFGVNPSLSTTSDPNAAKALSIVNQYLGLNASFTPIGMSNYVPVITNASFMTGYSFQAKVGGEAFGGYLHGGVTVSKDIVQFMKDGTRQAYGYLNLQNASIDDMLDFTRDRDGRYNRKMKYLPPGNTTYDIYSVSGQGTAGSFRAFRNDIGPVYDPYITSENEKLSVKIEVGVGNVVEVGGDFTYSATTSNSGPWMAFNQPGRKYQSREINSLYEPYYFKQAGELTKTNEAFKSILPNNKLLTNQSSRINLEQNAITGTSLKNNTRIPRANLMYYHTAEEASNPNYSLFPKIESYPTPGNIIEKYNFNRIGNYRKKHHISEITQILPDGRRYMYSIPAMNIEQREYVFSVNSLNKFSLGTVNKVDGKVMHNNCKVAYQGDPNFGQKYHMESITPAHAHSYLLSAVLSPDYSDLTGDGITDDDLGNYTKFNYTLKDDNYHWRSPYKSDEARFDMGVRSDGHDDKGTVTTGKKEMWMLHSIESKNYVAEFFTSERADAKGSDDANVGTPGNNVSYKLDKIVLYSKNDRITVTDNNGTLVRSVNANAKPIKEVSFHYDYSLCQGIPNKFTQSSSADPGKLTLKAISIKNGQSDMGLLNPYKFEYSTNNPVYNEENKDVWGEYKSSNSLNMTPHEFPYVDQTDVNINDNAKAWNLTKVTLPSGGTIEVDYEMDDYSTVQDRRAMEMVEITGAGNSKTYSNSNLLYNGLNSPNLFLYFKRKANEPYGTSEFRKNYLDEIKTMQFNFEVKIHQSTTESCPNLPLEDNVKGYVDVKDVGICDVNSTMGYIEIEPKWATDKGKLTVPDKGKLKLNPIIVSAIHYAQYYNNKAIYPASEIVNADVEAILSQLGTALKEYSNFVKSPMIEFLNMNLAHEFNLQRSYVRLHSQGFKKGGGHRVKELKYHNSWNQMDPSAQGAEYGFKYDYTMINADNKVVSSGVASYEPLGGGDENPFRNRVHTDRIGNDSKFPMVDPIELIVEEPLGESLFPPANVGYSKVTITSIHKSVGESSQTVQEHEFYTARDFPVSVIHSDIDEVTSISPRKLSFKKIKKDIYEVAQAYLITLNDMHGKAKKNRTYIDRDGKQQEVSSTYYEYYTGVNQNTGKIDLNNKVKCIDALESSNLAVVEKELGVEEDFTFDIRQKNEISRTWGLNINTNTFLIGVIPVPIPTPVPRLPAGGDKTFSSAVTTKVVQKYGIVKSVITTDKGATVKLSNDLFDANTGQVLLTTVNTEHNDKEYNLNTPAYWAYKGMGPSFQNIHYEQNISSTNGPSTASIVNEKCYIYMDDNLLKRFKVGDELEMNLKNTCLSTAINGGEPDKFKLWITEIRKGGVNLPQAAKQACSPGSPCTGGGDFPLNEFYKLYHVEASGTEYQKSMDACFKPIKPLHYLEWYIHDQTMLNHLTNSVKPEIIEIEYLGNGPCFNPVQMPSYWTKNVYPSTSTCTTSYTPSFPANDVSTQAQIAYPNLQGYNLNTPGITNPKKVKFVVGVTDPSPTGNPNKLLTSNKLIKYTYLVKRKPDYYLLADNNNGAPLYNTFQSARYNAGNMYSYLTNTDNVNAIDDDAQAFLNTTTTYTPFNGGSSVTATPYLLPLANITGLPVGNLQTWQNYAKVSVYLPFDDPNNQGNFTNVWGSVGGSIPWSYHHFQRVTSLYQGQACAGPLCSDESERPFYHPYIPYNPPSGNGTNRIDMVMNLDIKRDNVEVIGRDQVEERNQSNCIVAIPIKRGAKAVNTANIWPVNDTIHEATIKVVRSGARNMLTENIQELSTLNNPISSNTLALNHNRTINISATEYKDNGVLPDELNAPYTIYFNPFVLGVRGTFKPFRVFSKHDNRIYTFNSGLGELVDKDKGLINSVQAYWDLHTGSNLLSKFLVLEPVSTASSIHRWYHKTEVTKYSPWGNDLEVRDASGNMHSNIFGYGNKLPVAIVSNSESDNAMNENFEDYGDRYKYFVLNNAAYMPFVFKFFNNPLREFIKNNPGLCSIVSTAHTGTSAISMNSGINIPIVVSPSNLISIHGKPTMYPFYFRNGKYVLSYWQKANSLNAQAQPYGTLRVLYNGTNQVLKPKTPVINGWVLYEGVIDLTTSVNPSTATLTTNNTCVIDDIRLMPYESNMKSYVYHPTTQKLIAVLDENNAATLFEYSPEGKLVRIKKETEKGVLTLKESRESLVNILGPLFDPNGNQIIDQTKVFALPNTSALSIPIPVTQSQ